MEKELRRIIKQAQSYPASLKRLEITWKEYCVREASSIIPAYKELRPNIIIEYVT